MKIPVKEKLTKKEQIEKYRNNIPDIHSGAYRKNYDLAMQRKSFRAAVKAKCLDCMSWQSAEVSKCDNYSCPLWPYKPYSKRQSSEKCVSDE